MGKGQRLFASCYCPLHCPTGDSVFSDVKLCYCLKFRLNRSVSLSPSFPLEADIFSCCNGSPPVCGCVWWQDSRLLSSTAVASTIMLLIHACACQLSTLSSSTKPGSTLSYFIASLQIAGKAFPLRANLWNAIQCSRGYGTKNTVNTAVDLLWALQSLTTPTCVTQWYKVKFIWGYLRIFSIKNTIHCPFSHASVGHVSSNLMPLKDMKSYLSLRWWKQIHSHILICLQSLCLLNSFISML